MIFCMYVFVFLDAAFSGMESHSGMSKCFYMYVFGFLDAAFSGYGKPDSKLSGTFLLIIINRKRTA